MKLCHRSIESRLPEARGCTSIPRSTIERTPPRTIPRIELGWTQLKKTKKESLPPSSIRGKTKQTIEVSMYNLDRNFQVIPIEARNKHRGFVENFRSQVYCLSISLISTRPVFMMIFPRSQGRIEMFYLPYELVASIFKFHVHHCSPFWSTWTGKIQYNTNTYIKCEVRILTNDYLRWFDLDHLLKNWLKKLKTLIKDNYKSIFLKQRLKSQPSHRMIIEKSWS